jgi:ABC-type transport system involved in multi-copper enzyme maturation permease subunit
VKWEARQGAVVWREVARSARRWQTYAARSGFSAVLLGVLVLGIWLATAASSVDWIQSTNAPWIGRALFITFTSIQVLVSLFMAPVVTARAVIEERVEGTLELLILTPLTTRTLLLGKVASRLLVLSMIVLGSLPLLALAVTLGGVAVTEVVLATLGNAVTLVVMGALGAFFALFTRSPLLAALAAAGWAFLAFLGLPAVFGLLIAQPAGAAQVSPFFASLGDWSGLVLPLMWAPTVVLVWLLGARMFELSAANAAVSRYFDPAVWASRSALWGFVAFVVASCTLLPVGVGLCWSTHDATSLGGTAVFAVGWVLAALWTQGLILLSTWLYLRLGMDLVDALERMLDGVGAQRSKLRINRAAGIGHNPVRWRETRSGAWGRGAVPVLAIWGLILLALLQSGLWIFPGGVLGLGIANAGLGIVLAVWIGVGSIEQERRGRSLDLLRVSTLTSRAIIGGKLAGLAVPSLPLVLFGGLLVFLGTPHAAFFTLFGASSIGLELVLMLVRGALSAAWLVGLWFVASTLGVVLALRMRNPASAYAMVGAILGSGILLPAFLSWTIQSRWLAMPFRLLAAPFIPGDAIVELIVATIGMGVLGVGLYAVAVARLRTWGEGA